MTAVNLLDKLKPSKGKSAVDVADLRAKCYAAMDDDFNSPILIAELFEVVRSINSIYDGKATISTADLEELRAFVQHFVFDILGLQDDQLSSNDNVDEIMAIVIKLRDGAKQNKDFATSDRIREELNAIGIQLKDSKDGTLWNKI